MIHIRYNGRFGNNLFQHSVAAMISIDLGIKIANPLGSYLVRPIENYDNEGTILVDGFFQNRQIVDKILLNKREILCEPTETIDGVFVHVRLGDIAGTKKACDYEYYDRAISACSFSSGYVSSDSPDHPIVARLANKYGLKIDDCGAEDQVIYMASKYTNKVLSLGTFSWWIGALGCQDNVICPNPTDYEVWHGDLFPALNWKTL